MEISVLSSQKTEYGGALESWQNGVPGLEKNHQMKRESESDVPGL